MASIAIDRTDGLSSATAIKGPVRVATTANIALTGLQTVDGVSLAAGDRVLVKDQATASENGIYVVDTGPWRRAKDFSGNRDVRKGTQILVTSGTLYASSGWYVSSADPIVIGTTAIQFTQNILLNAAQLIALEAVASASADSASDSADAAAADLASMLGIFLGAYASDAAAEAAHPGRASGSRYFNTTDGRDRVWTGAAWTYAGNGDMVGSANLSDVSNPTLAAGNLKLIERDTVALLLADTILAYAPATGKTVVATSQIVKAGGFRYKVAASGASDHHVTTAGGVKLYVLPTITGKYNVMAFGAKADGVTDDAAIIQKALDAGVAVIFPKGDYKVNSTIVIPYAATIAGLGQGRTRFLSGVIGGSLFVTASPSAAYLHLHGFSCIGNSLSGVDGNGHAINFIDPAIDSGTHTPQQCLVERVTIIGFRGLDVVDNVGTNKIASCGVIQIDGLHNTYRKVLVQECGVPFLLYKAQNTRIIDCVTDGNDKAAAVVLDCENVIIDKCDFVSSGDGSADANWPLPAVSATVSSYRNEGFILQNTKIKTPKGCPLIASVTSQGDVIDGNWLRPESITDTVGQGILADRSSGIKIINNTFSPTSGTYGRKAQCITVNVTSTAGGVSGVIENNTFLDIPSGTIEWNIKLVGNAQARTINAMSIRNNDFGDNFAISSAGVVEADILFTTCTLNELVIADNKFCAVTNVTRNACIVQGASVTLNRPKIGPNSFLANGGTITANYSGITESELTGSATYDPPSLADAAGATTTVTVTGAALGDYVEAVSFDKDLQGITLTAYVSAANTVSVRFQNESGGVLDLASGTLRARVRKA